METAWVFQFLAVVEARKRRVFANKGLATDAMTTLCRTLQGPCANSSARPSGPKETARRHPGWSTRPTAFIAGAEKGSLLTGLGAT